MHRLHHIGITVSDTERSVEFYRALGAVDVVRPREKSGPAVEAATGYPGIRILLTFLGFGDGGTVIELAEYRGGGSRRVDPDNGSIGAAHPALLVDDIDERLRRVADLGYRALSAPMTATDGPMEGFRYVYVLGPDDVRVELLEEPH